MLTAWSCPLYVRQSLRGHLFLVHAGVSRGVRKRLCFHTMPVADTMTWCLSPPLRTEGPRPPDVSSSWKLSSPAVLPKVMFSCEGAARARWPLIQSRNASASGCHGEQFWKAPWASQLSIGSPEGSRWDSITAQPVLRPIPHPFPSFSEGWTQMCPAN